MPPAIAPIFNLDVVLAMEAVGAELVDDALVLVEDSELEIDEEADDEDDGTGGAMISVSFNSLYRRAAVALNMSACVTFKNAQAGMAVPTGTGLGKLNVEA